MASYADWDRFAADVMVHAELDAMKAILRENYAMAHAVMERQTAYRNASYYVLIGGVLLVITTLTIVLVQYVF